MYNVIVWGCGVGYNEYFNLLKYFEIKGEITILGITSNDSYINTTIDGYRFIKKKEIKNINFDYCIYTILNFDLIKEEAKLLGITEKLIPIRVLKIPHFSFEKYIKLKEENPVSILSRNCFGGICYHYLGFKFQSPTINMFFWESEFNKFIMEMDYYLSLPVEFAKVEYDPYLKRYYPIGKLDDVFLGFNHYYNFEEAVSAWERRKKRLDRNNMVIVSYTDDKDVALEFSKLPQKNKLIFIPKELNIKDRSFFPVDYIKNETETMGMYINKIANGSLGGV